MYSEAGLRWQYKKNLNSLPSIETANLQLLINMFPQKRPRNTMSRISKAKDKRYYKGRRYRVMLCKEEHQRDLEKS